MNETHESMYQDGLSEFHDFLTSLLNERLEPFRNEIQGKHAIDEIGDEAQAAYSRYLEITFPSLFHGLSSFPYSEMEKKEQVVDHLLEETNHYLLCFFLKKKQEEALYLPDLSNESSEISSEMGDICTRIGRFWEASRSKSCQS